MSKFVQANTIKYTKGQWTETLGKFGASNVSATLQRAC